MQELVQFGQEMMSAAKQASNKVARAQKSVKNNADKDNAEAAEAVRKELGLSPLRGPAPMYATMEEAAAASADPGIQEITHLDEAISGWIEQSFEELD